MLSKHLVGQVSVADISKSSLEHYFPFELHYHVLIKLTHFDKLSVNRERIVVRFVDSVRNLFESVCWHKRSDECSYLVQAEQINLLPCEYIVGVHLLSIGNVLVFLDDVVKYIEPEISSSSRNWSGLFPNGACSRIQPSCSVQQRQVNNYLISARFNLHTLASWSAHSSAHKIIVV